MEDSFIKLTNTVYSILDCLPENDPLKNRAKEKVLAILENMTLVFGTSGWISLQKEKASAQLPDDIEVLINYLVVGKTQGWVSSVNFLIITNQYRDIKNNIRPPEGIIKKSIEIANSMVMDPKPPMISSKEQNGALVYLEKFSERQDKILHILEAREKTQVSDIIKELPNITKRTIRRDLDDLLKRGKIMRVGEWNQVFYKVLKDFVKTS
ncbi:MAG: hypothetical protein A2908_01585 [Candidatus Staskawiczbacteria bacterium RIFCSPLOWO2_01_FULL_38_12b]|uniref:HTH deoR-type domain-containing protein n=1 Tax=Candidatus Staskawiczbacteria bacterium RIFCSPLOWO2_01_FULL_38_12b TaxID=1802214 RepID=A0A1G2ICS7_9BACT|nr:MAG: hypothetical protein A2908_01585 [Candidatus Staskawiczbacteria bacterium RIFCSPLOWO2_01_FULL_38_12b]